MSGYFTCLLVLLAGVLLVFWHLASQTRDVDYHEVLPYVDCLVLSLTPVRTFRMGPIQCSHFPGRAFHESDLVHVNESQRRKLITGENDPSDIWELSNNKTVSIYLNHAAIWRRVVQKRRMTLVLEDDVVIRPDKMKVLLNLVYALRGNTSMHNYVVRAFRSEWWNTLRQWDHVPEMSFGTQLYHCSCMSTLPATSTGAYLLDPAGARTLLSRHLPIWTHVDLFMLWTGCGERAYALFNTYDNLFESTGRPSQHIETLSLSEFVTRLAWHSIGWQKQATC
jgi:hypothetical protein